MSEAPQTDVSRPSALPTANFLQRSGTGSQVLLDQNSAEYLDTIEEEWNKKVDMEVEILVDGMVDLVSLASVRPYRHFIFCHRDLLTWYPRSSTKTNSALHKSPSRLSPAQNLWCASHFQVLGRIN